MSSTIVVDTVCRMCQTSTPLEVSSKGVEAWQSGTLIQNALPELNADQRELLISGTCSNVLG